MEKKRIGVCLVGMALFAVCIAGCKKEVKKEEQIELLAPVEAVVDIETAISRDLYKVTTRDAELAPYTQELSFDSAGTLSQLYVEVGSEVKAGDLLAEQEEEGVRDLANTVLDRYLSEKKIYMDAVKSARKKIASGLSAEEKEWQEMLIRQAEELWAMQEPILWSAWEEARSKVGVSQIIAPCDGVVTACIKEGSNVAAGQSVMALADMSRLYITSNVYVSPSEYSGYKDIYAIINGKETELIYLDELMQEKGSYSYFDAVDLNGAQIGDFILLCMVSDYHEDVLSVPNNAVYRDSNGSYVYLMEEDGRVRREVTTGYKTDVYVEIVEGLQEGDRVYVKK